MPGSQRFSLVGHCAVPFPSRFDPSIYVLRSSLIPLGEKFPVQRLNHGFFDGSRRSIPISDISAIPAEPRIKRHQDMLSCTMWMHGRLRRNRDRRCCRCARGPKIPKGLGSVLALEIWAYLMGFSWDFNQPKIEIWSSHANLLKTNGGDQTNSHKAWWYHGIWSDGSSTGFVQNGGFDRHHLVFNYQKHGFHQGVNTFGLVWKWGIFGCGTNNMMIGYVWSLDHLIRIATFL